MSDTATVAASATSNFQVIDLDQSDAAGQGQVDVVAPAHQSPPSAAIHQSRRPIPTSSTPTPIRYAAVPPSGPGSLAARAQITVQLDTEILMAAEDQAQACGQTLAEWCQANVNDALRGYLGA